MNNQLTFIGVNSLGCEKVGKGLLNPNSILLYCV